MSSSISSSISLPPVCSIVPSKKVDLELELQKAFDQMDLDLILHLLDQGANPRQEIHFTRELTISLVDRLVDKFDEIYKDAILCVQEDYLSILTGDLNQIINILQVREKIINDEPVTADTLKETCKKILMLEVNYLLENREKELTWNQIQFALSLENKELIEKLLEVGVTLEEISTVTSTNYLAPEDLTLNSKEIDFIDFLISIGLRVDQIIEVSVDSLHSLAARNDYKDCLDFMEKRGFNLSFFLNERPDSLSHTHFCELINECCSDMIINNDERNKNIISFALYLMKRNSLYFEKNFDEKFNIYFGILDIVEKNEDLFLEKLSETSLSWIEKCYQIMKGLLEHGVSIKNFSDCSSVQFDLALVAIWKKDMKMLELLAQNGSDFNCEPSFSNELYQTLATRFQYPLGFAVGDYGIGEMDEEICRFLINHGAKVDRLSLESQEKLKNLILSKED
jgi:hypothetical protein